MNLDESANIYEYEEILLGKKKGFGSSFECSLNERKQAVGNIWRYAISELLGWTPAEALKYLTNDIVIKLRLDKTLVGIDRDLKKNYMGDFRYVLQFAFPDIIKWNLKTEAISEYEHVCKIGPWANDKKFYKYPKTFFGDEFGIERAQILLRYAIGRYLSDYSVSELYEFFEDDKFSRRWLREKKLNIPLSTIYFTPVDYLFSSLGYMDENFFYYYISKINSITDPDEEMKIVHI